MIHDSTSIQRLYVVVTETLLRKRLAEAFNKRQLVERNKAKLYFRQFNNFQHVERHIASFSIT